MCLIKHVGIVSEKQAIVPGQEYIMEGICVKNRINYRRWTSVAAIALSTHCAIAAQAQDTAATIDSAGDIVVTARRSEENIQSTPVSVTAFNDEMLRSASISETADLM